MSPTNIKKIGKYDVLGQIGRGGMGVVYKATDPSLDRLVAIKMMGGAFEADGDLLKRFYREAQSTASLHHPNIVTVHDLGEHEGNPYIVMEFLEGESLQEILSRKRALPLLTSISYVLQVCRGLEYAHARQIVHRDIKPANVVVLSDSSVKIVDFGIAQMGDLRVTRPGQVVGSVEYMSPEQITDGSIDPRTDIFAVGVLLFQLITLELPFRGREISGTLMKIVHDPPPPLSRFLASYPAELETIIKRALAKDKNDRYQSVDDLTFDLHQVEGQLKRHPAKEMLQRSTELMAREQWTGAREQLLELLRIDPQNSQANDLMRQAQQQLQLRRRREQVREFKLQMEQFVAQEQFATALQLLQQAMPLDDSGDLERYRDQVQDLSDRFDKVQSALQRAQAAKAVGDLDRAVQFVGEVLQLNPDHAEGLALRDLLADEITGQARSRELQQLLDKARREISARKFPDALNTLMQVEQLDPNVPNLRQLTRLASEGREQELRRQELHAAAAKIQDALNANDFGTASAHLQDMLQRFPNEASLLNLKALTERQQERFERRTWVDARMSVARKCMDEGHLEEALATLEDAVQRYPTEATVQALLAIVQQSLVLQRAEKRKAEVIAMAKEAMRRKAFEEAVRTLEAAQTELKTTDFEDLIAFARDEAVDHARQLRLEAIANQSLTLMENQEHERAIELLEGELQVQPDQDLFFLLESARERLGERQRIEQELVKTVDHLLNQDKAEEAMALLEKERGVLARSRALAAATERAELKRQWLSELSTQREKVQKALACRDFKQAEAALNACRSRFGDRPDFASLDQELQSGRREVHTAEVEKALSDAMMLAKFGSLEQALDAVERVAESVCYLSTEEKHSYETYTEQLRRAVQLKHKAAREKDADGRWDREDAKSTEPLNTAQEEERERDGNERERIETQPDQLRPEGQIGSPFLREKWINLKAAFSRRRSELGAAASAEQRQRRVEELTPPPGITVPHGEGPRDPATDLNSPLPARNVAEATSTLHEHSATASTFDSYEPVHASNIPPASPASDKGELPGTSFPRATGQRWPEDALVYIEKQLAAYVGPLARVIVRRAVSKATDWNELYTLVAESLDSESERHAFLASKDDSDLRWARAEKVERNETTLAGASQKASARAKLSPEVIAQAKRSLARHLGPISSVLVRNAAQRAETVRELYSLLASELEDEAERTQFLRDAGFSI